MELNEKLVREDLKEARENFYDGDFSDKARLQIGFEIKFLRRLLKYCGLEE